MILIGQRLGSLILGLQQKIKISIRSLKNCRKEQKTIRLARRFDVDPKLSEYIYSKPIMQREDQLLIAGIMAEVRGPFKTMWIEFLDEKGGVVGCLQEDFGYEIGFQFFKEGEFLDRSVVIHRESKAHWIVAAANKELFLPRHSLETFGISRYSFNGDDPYLKLLRSTDVMLKQMYSSEFGGVNEDFNPARFVRFVAMLMITLNYPWVTHEKVGVLRGEKARTRALFRMILTTDVASICRRTASICESLKSLKMSVTASGCIKCEVIGECCETTMAHSTSAHG